jgi:cysteinyl-tRNA synthetase, unknown class
VRMLCYTGCLPVFLMLFSGCPGEDRDYRQDMRNFVQAIAAHARITDTDFIVIPQNGQELLTRDGEPDGVSAAAYIAAIDGQGREDLFYGYDEDDEATPAEDRDWMLAFLGLAESKNVEALVTDYCATPSKMRHSHEQNARRDFISFAADSRELDQIPDYPETPWNENEEDITSLAETRNFLYLINPDRFADRIAFIEALAATNYDLIIMDLFFGDHAFTATELATLRVKANGGKRLLICYMSIGEAEDYRYYWNAAWYTSEPDWLGGENPAWPGNYKVEYWNPAWQAVIFGNENAYLDRILAAGFDGVYLDIIDAFEYFE